MVLVKNYINKLNDRDNIENQISFLEVDLIKYFELELSKKLNKKVTLKYNISMGASSWYSIYEGKKLIKDFSIFSYFSRVKHYQEIEDYLKGLK
jgi:hypothetical protein